MRLGGPVSAPAGDVDGWVAAMRAWGFSAAYCPVGADAADDRVKAYRNAAERAGIVIAEVGAWSNPISRDEAERKKALGHCQRQLALAEQIGAHCCVNIAGSRGAKWDGPDEAHYARETFDLIVQSVREIVDAVKPARAVYALETMPWIAPDSADSYLALLKAIDRKSFAVHLDVVNMINSPERFYHNGALIRECFAKLGPWIRGCHGKDIVLADRLTVHLDEARPGLGRLDYPTLLREMEKIGPETPLMLEHLPNEEEYRAAAVFVRTTAASIGVRIV